MIQAVAFVGSEPAGATGRLQRGGVRACTVASPDAADAAIKEWGFEPKNVLVIGHSVPGALSWADVAQQGSSHPTSSDQVMQALVQHNRRHLLAAAAASPTAAKQQQQQQQQQQRPAVLVVGYVMKPSREEQLASAGLLPLLPGSDGLCFMPFDVGQLAAHQADAAMPQQQQQQQQGCIDAATPQQQQQGQGHIDHSATATPQQQQQPQCHIDAAGPQQQQQGHIHLLLHKGSDELVAGPDGAVGWSSRLHALQGWLRQQQQAHVAVVDPFEATAKVLDRLVLGQLLDELQQLPLPPGVVARAPRYSQVEDYAAAGLPELLAQHGMRPPFIVKPAVACGVAHSHSMALALTPGALASLAGRLPLPGLVCEFVNHGGMQHKVYVLGDKVFVTPRASIPDVHSSPDLPPEQQLLLFDSLASLPTQLPPHFVQQPSSSTGIQEQGESSSGRAGAQQQQQQQLKMQAVEAIAAFLRVRLGLTLFGFDVVLASSTAAGSSTISSSEAVGQAQQQQQELVVIDVNYFPNYRGGSNTPALFRQALLQRWQQHTAGLVGE